MLSLFGLGHNSNKDPVAQQNEPIRVILKSCQKAMRLIFWITFLVEVLSVAPILYMLNMYDKVMSSRSEVTLISLTLLILGVYVFWSTLEWIRTRFMIRVSLRIDWDIAGRVFDAAFRKYAGKRQLNPNQVFGDLTILRQFMTGSSVLAVMKAPFGLLFIIIAAFFHPYLAIFALIASILLVMAAYSNQRVSTPILKAANDMQSESVRLAAQALQQGETAIALGMQPHLKKRWHDKHLAYLQMQVGASEAGGFVNAVSSFLTHSLPSLQMGLGVFLAIQGLITGGMVIAASYLISRSVQPIQQVLGSWKNIISVRQSYDRLNSLLEDDTESGERMQLPPPLGKLSLSNVICAPAGVNKPILNNVTFSVEPGSVVAVVGPSAAGKTSLAKLLVGIWRPERGTVRLDGAEISDWAHDNLGRYIGYVPQEIVFFEGTVAENIARFSEINAAKVVQAAKTVGIHEMILGFPQGYDTKIGDGGHALTGGQKQRLAIARAVYGAPRYLVMDEPNANLDEASEAALKEMLLKLKSEKVTVVFSTHRHTLVHVADYLLALNDGRQLAFGRASEVLGAAQKFVAQKQTGTTEVIG